jgi:hypothetical protein
MLVLDRVHHVGVSEYSVSGLHLQDRGKSFQQKAVILGIDRESAARFSTA